MARQPLAEGDQGEHRGQSPRLGSPTEDLSRGFNTSPPDGFSPASFPPAQRGAGMHVMATEREENVTSPGDLGDTSPLPPEQDRGIDPQAGPVNR